MTATLPVARQPRPHRMVDRYQRGWITAVDPCTTYPRLDNGRWTLARLEAERAPLRPVVAMTDDDRTALVEILTGAGYVAVATVMAGLFSLSKSCYNADGSDARLIAGEPESEASRLLPRFAWEIGINLTAARFNPRAVAGLERIVRGWIFAKESYVEVAGNLADVLAEVVRQGGGYERVSDQWLRNGVLADEIERYVTSKL